MLGKLAEKRRSRSYFFLLLVCLFLGLLLIIEMYSIDTFSSDDWEFAGNKAIDDAVGLQDDWIQAEMNPLKGRRGWQKRKRILIVSYWRSGSSFLGGLFESHPGMMYVYEPLQDLQDKIARSTQETNLLLTRLSSLFSCNFLNQSDYLKHEQDHSIGFKRSHKLWHWCTSGEFSCYDEEFLSKFCSVFPFITIKVVRSTLSSVKLLLEADVVDKVLLLVRDPRGTFNSRRRMTWCKQPDCKQSDRHCSDLENDYHSLLRLQEKHKTSVAAIRYEDFTEDPINVSKKIMSWAGLWWTESLEKFVLTHTTRTLVGRNSFSLYKQNLATQGWLKENQQWIGSVQEKCVDAMRLWGYVPLAPTSNKTTFKAYTPLNFTIQ